MMKKELKQENSPPFLARNHSHSFFNNANDKTNNSKLLQPKKPPPEASNTTSTNPTRRFVKTATLQTPITTITNNQISNPSNTSNSDDKKLVSNVVDTKKYSTTTSTFGSTMNSFLQKKEGLVLKRLTELFPNFNENVNFDAKQKDLNLNIDDLPINFLEKAEEIEKLLISGAEKTLLKKQAIQYCKKNNPNSTSNSNLLENNSNIEIDESPILAIDKFWAEKLPNFLNSGINTFLRLSWLVCRLIESHNSTIMNSNSDSTSNSNSNNSQKTKEMELDIENQNLKKRIEQFENQQKEQKKPDLSILSNLQKQNESLGHENLDLKNQISTLNQKFEKVKKDNELLMNLKSQTLQGMRSSAEENEKLSLQLLDKTKENENLNKKLNDLEKQNDAFKADSKRLENEAKIEKEKGIEILKKKNILQMEIDAFNNQNVDKSSIEAGMNALNSKIKDLELQNSALSRKNQILTNENSEKKLILDEKSKKLSEIETIFQKVNNENLELKNKMDEAESNCEELHMLTINLKTKTKNLEELVAKREKEAKQFEIDKLVLEKQVQKAISNNDNSIPKKLEIKKQVCGEDGQEISSIMVVVDGDEKINQILVQEIDAMRVMFDDKLRKAHDELDLIRKAHTLQLIEINETVRLERNLLLKKVEKLRERCVLMEEELESFRKLKTGNTP